MDILSPIVVPVPLLIRQASDARKALGQQHDDVPDMGVHCLQLLSLGPYEKDLQP